MPKRVFGREFRNKAIPYIQERRYRCLRQLTTSLRGGNLDPHIAFGFIGELASLQGILDDLESEAKEENRQMMQPQLRRR